MDGRPVSQIVGKVQDEESHHFVIQIHGVTIWSTKSWFFWEVVCDLFVFDLEDC